MPKPEWSPPMSRRRRRLIAVLATTATVAALLPTSASTAAPAGSAPSAERRSGPFAEGHEPADIDNRPARRRRRPAARPGRGRPTRPSAGTRSAPRTRSAPAGTPLATGLSADPETAARAVPGRATATCSASTQPRWPTWSGCWSGRSARARSSLLRQRFGDLPAAHDGLVAVAVSRRHGAPGQLLAGPRHRARPQPATLSAPTGVAAALRRRGADRRRRSASHDVRLVAVPTPADGPRAAYEVTLIGPTTPTTRPRTPPTWTRRTGEVLVREDLVDFDSDNPQLGGLPGHPAADAARATPGCAGASPGARLRARGASTRPPARRGTSTSPPARRRSPPGQLGQHRASRWGAGTPAVPATPSPTRDYVYPFTDQWHQARCDPAVFTSAQRNDADAAIANLFAMHNRMHDWAYHLGLHRGDLEPAGGQPRPGRARRRRRAGPRPAGRADRQPQQRQPGHPAGRPAADHQHVPVAAGRRRGVPAVRRRRLRHDGDRPRVHPRDHQPDDRRPGQRHRLVSRAARWASAGAT